MADRNEPTTANEAAEKLREVQFAIQNEQHRHADELHRLARELRAAQAAMVTADPTWLPVPTPPIAMGVPVAREVLGPAEPRLEDVVYQEPDRG